MHRSLLGRAVRRAALFLGAASVIGCASPLPAPPWRGAAGGSFAPALQRAMPWAIGVYGVTDRRADTAAEPGDAAPADALLPDPADPEATMDVRIGAGFFVDGDGHAVTAAHVVQDMARVVVRLADQRVLAATVVGLDEDADIALLRLPEAPAGAPPLGRSTRLRAGDWVMAVGEPYGLNRSVTAGVVGGTDRHFGDDHELLFIQSDLALNPGNSGGPLIDAGGAIVGLNLRTMAGVFGTPGVSLSVPVEIVRQVADELRATGGVRRPRLGAQFTDLAPPLAAAQGRATAQGAVVLGVSSGSLGERIGLRAGDVVVAMDGRAVADSADLARRLLAWREAAGTQFVVRRGALVQRLVVTVAPP